MSVGFTCSVHTIVRVSLRCALGQRFVTLDVVKAECVPVEFVGVGHDKCRQTLAPNCEGRMAARALLNDRWLRMTSLVLLLGDPLEQEALLTDCEAAGMTVHDVVHSPAHLVCSVGKNAPNVVVVSVRSLSDEILQHTQTIGATFATPVLVFTHEANEDHMDRVLASGVHLLVINGYAPHRLCDLVNLTRARFRRDQAQADALAEITIRLEERKAVDRAKGILMHARQVSDDDAFRMLRTAAMQTNQRLGQVSTHIIESARMADCVNRSGQLRMLSQRLVKLYVLQLAGTKGVQHRHGLKESMQRIDANLVQLEKHVSQPDSMVLRRQLVANWDPLKQLVQSTPQVQQLKTLDELAERFLQSAEQLTSWLENAGATAPLRVLNLAGRQRMLTQRCAKLALLVQVGEPGSPESWSDSLRTAQSEFEGTLAHLRGLPLTSADIREGLDGASSGWQDMLLGMREVSRAAGRERLAVASESLLEAFESLSGHYERSMQTLMG